MSIELVGGQLYQWETGRQLMIAADASEANAIQFANQGDTTALEIEQNFTMEDGDIYVKIPDKCLQSAKNLLVYLVYNEASENSDEHKSRIFATKIFPVTAKPRPKNYIPIAAEEALGVVRRLTAAAQEAAREAEEHRIHAQTAREVAETARDKAILEKQAAETARNAAVKAQGDAEAAAETAEEWGEAAVVAAISAENYEAFSYENSQAAADSKTKAEKAKGDAQSAATKAENAKATAVQEAEKAKAQAANAKNSADSAAASAEAAGDSARDAVAGAMPQIMASIDEKLKTKASINDTTIGADAWSSQKIIETLCPPIEESGMVMQCYPLDGTQLNVRWDSDNVNEVHICGKNLYDAAAYPLKNNQIIRHTSGAYAYSNTFAATEKYIPCDHLQGQTISIRHAPKNTEAGSTGGGIAFYSDDNGYLSGTSDSKVTVPAEAAFFRFCINMDYDHEAQIELGANVTEYVPYVGKMNYVDGVMKEAIITPVSGLNTIWLTDGSSAYDGMVTGFADPKAEIKRLKDIVGAASVATTKEE